MSWVGLTGIRFKASDVDRRLRNLNYFAIIIAIQFDHAAIDQYVLNRNFKSLQIKPAQSFVIEFFSFFVDHKLKRCSLSVTGVVVVTEQGSGQNRRVLISFIDEDLQV